MIGALLTEAVRRMLAACKILNNAGLIQLNGYFAAMAVGAFFPLALPQHYSPWRRRLAGVLRIAMFVRSQSGACRCW